LGSTKAIDEFIEAKALGIVTTPVLIGPVSFLALGKSAEGDGFNRYEFLFSLLPIYGQILSQLAQAGANSVQFDEPALVFGSDKKMEAALLEAYTTLSGAAKGLRISIATYFEGLGAGIESVLNLPVSCVH
jgi:5-methyltetrahydropteroyltriglutamate--homocysteine methyltransferase